MCTYRISRHGADGIILRLGIWAEGYSLPKPASLCSVVCPMDSSISPQNAEAQPPAPYYHAGLVAPDEIPRV